MRQKGFVAPLVLIVIVVFLAVIGGVYYLGRSSSRVSPSVSPTASMIIPNPISTAGWQTYTNLTYHYLVKFPTAYEFFGPSDRQMGQLGWNQDSDVRFCPTRSPDTCPLEIYAEDNPKMLSLDDFLNDFYNRWRPKTKPSWTQTSLNGYQAVTYSEANGKVYDIASGRTVLFVTIGKEDTVASRILSTLMFAQEAASSPVVIPINWKSFTVRDPEFGIETTLSLPPGYRFEFTGSETSIISDSSSPEVWDYSSSVFIGRRGDRNYYNGESRRAWYQDLLNGKFKPISDVFPPEKILEVSEYPVGQSSYLKLLVDIGSGMKRTDYLYVQNNIVHIFKTSSEKANLTSSPIGMNIGVIFTSLTSKQFTPTGQ